MAQLGFGAQGARSPPARTHVAREPPCCSREGLNIRISRSLMQNPIEIRLIPGKPPPRAPAHSARATRGRYVSGIPAQHGPRSISTDCALQQGARPSRSLPEEHDLDAEIAAELADTRHSVLSLYPIGILLATFPVGHNEARELPGHQNTRRRRLRRDPPCGTTHRWRNGLPDIRSAAQASQR